ncbi:MAG: co-chaperone GroES [Acholeplasmataceae bacterium]|jgi:Co-chaperonin GroES (HSP10)|nr:co-chaperone GroES [Acholeplasmataceae bacterium]
MLKPLEDYVVIKPIVQEEKTSSGIYLPDTAHKDKPQTGNVVAIGAGRLLDNGQRVASELEVGQTVVFAKYAGSELEFDGVDYVVMKERDILAIVESKPKAPVKATTANKKHS